MRKNEITFFTIFHRNTNSDHNLSKTLTKIIQIVQIEWNIVEFHSTDTVGPVQLYTRFRMKQRNSAIAWAEIIKKLTCEYCWFKVATSEWARIIRYFCSQKNCSIQIYVFYGSNGIFFRRNNSTYKKLTRFMVEFLQFFYRNF